MMIKLLPTWALIIEIEAQHAKNDEITQIANLTAWGFLFALAAIFPWWANLSLAFFVLLWAYFKVKKIGPY